MRLIVKVLCKSELFGANVGLSNNFAIIGIKIELMRK